MSSTNFKIIFIDDLGNKKSIKNTEVYINIEQENTWELFQPFSNYIDTVMLLKFKKTEENHNFYMILNNSLVYSNDKTIYIRYVGQLIFYKSDKNKFYKNQILNNENSKELKKLQAKSFFDITETEDIKLSKLQIDTTIQKLINLFSLIEYKDKEYEKEF